MKIRISRKYIYSSLCYLLLALLTVGVSPLLSSCHDEPVADDTTIPDDQEDGTRVIDFNVPNGHFTIRDNEARIVVSLISIDGETQVFDAMVGKSDNDLRFRLMLPPEVSIGDGRYIMTIRHENGQCIPGRLACVFERESLTSVNIILPAYMLDGSGTLEDPYIIADDSDFEMFLINLADDTESFGAGLKFLQTADVKAPDQSSLIPGRGYWGSPFAGIYDGGGHEIKGMYYRGSNRENSDSGFGVFQKLIGSSTIENLSMTGVNVSGLYKESGMIAGSVSGDIAFRNISLAGNIGGGYSLGGLTGVVLGGSLTVENISFGASVSGGDNVGGLVGKINKGAKAMFSDIKTPDTHFTVDGKNHVGGVVGETAAPASFKNIRIDHKVSNEDSDIRIISGSGTGTGGVIGAVTGNTKGILLTDCYVLTSLGGADASGVGGLVGDIEGSEVRISDCRIYSVVNGKSNVGGLLGKIKMDQLSDGLIISGDNFSTRIAVDDADAGVSGVDYVGGFAGWLEGPVSLKSDIKINVPVSATGSGAGGAIGCAYLTTVDASRFSIGDADSASNTIHISGQKETGGIVGRLWEANLSANSDFKYVMNGDDATLPKADQFKPAFNGVVTGTEMVGGIVGYGLRVSIWGICSAAHVTGTGQVGGIIGKMEDYFYSSANMGDCTFKGILDCASADKVGGIVGHYRSVGMGSVHDCINFSDIRGGDSEGGTAGIIGYVSKCQPVDEYKIFEVNWCANLGKINGTMHVGGIVGRVYDEDSTAMGLGPITYLSISISDCVNTGAVYGEGGSSSNAGVGGILGFSNYLTGVARCANHAEVYGHNACHGIGGIAGSMGHDPSGTGLNTHYRNMLLQQCINTGSVNAGNRSSFVGGILGYQEEGEQSNVEDCVNHGVILPKQDHDSGGIVGCVDHLTYIYRCVNKGKVEHGNATIGTHKNGSIFHHDYLYFLEGTGAGWPSATKLSADNFVDESRYKGLDFKEVWKMTPQGPMLQKNKWNNKPI